MSRNVAVFLIVASVWGGAAAAQGGVPDVKKKLEEIADLMRQSERLLLEITQIDRVVESQDEIVRKLKELEDDAPRSPAAAPPPADEERERARRELQEKQAEV
ncbi:MAG: hypothetical protein ACREID_04210, partial [Planctomycetota bacterium]